MGSNPNFMMRACNCFPPVAECFWVQALRTNKNEKLSIVEGLFLISSLKNNRALVMQLELRYFLRAWFAFGGLR